MEVALAIGVVSFVLGGIFGVFDNFSQVQSAKKEKEFTEKQIQENAKDKLDLLDLNFEIEKTEANKKADDLYNEANLLNDKTVMDEKNLAWDFNKGIDLLQAQNENDFFNFNIAAINAGQSTGTELANLSAAGIRTGSSLSEAIDMQASLNSQQLQLQENQSYLQNDINVSSLINNMVNMNFGIRENRMNISQIKSDANYLREGYKEDGIFTNLYNQKRTNIINDRDRQLSSLNYKYNEFVSEENQIKRVLGDAFGIGSSINNYATSLFTMPDINSANFNNLG